ncbi:MAG: hypothetical protein ACI82I_003144 [Gammaproteobacteria bacterium]|jgi:hypothetical protein
MASDCERKCDLGYRYDNLDGFKRCRVLDCGSDKGSVAFSGSRSDLCRLADGCVMCFDREHNGRFWLRY